MTAAPPTPGRAQELRAAARALAWPPGAVETVERIEAAFPHWGAWWSRQRPRHASGPGYGARLLNPSADDENLYANSYEALAAAIERADLARAQRDG